MQESLIVFNIVLGFVGSVVLSFILYFVFKRELKPFRKIGEMASAIFDDFDDAQKLQVGGLLDSLVPIAESANNLNAILSNEEAFDSSMTILANKIRKSFVAGLLGDASGDSKRMAKADTMISKAMVDMLEHIHPFAPVAAEALGLKDMVDNDPKMFDAIVATIFKKGGLLEIFKSQGVNIAGLGSLGDTSSLAIPKTERGEY